MTPFNTTTHNTTKYIRISQAEQMTGLPSEVIKKLVKQGKVDGYKPTYKLYLVDFLSIVNYIESKKVKPITKGAIL